MRTDRAVFVLVSDFGSADVTSGMTVPELVAAVNEAARSIWIDRKLSDLTDVVVPFRALDRDALAQLVEERFDGLAHELLPAIELNVQRVRVLNRRAVVDALVDTIVRDRQYRGMNGRAVEHVFPSKVADPVLLALEQLQRRMRRSASASVWSWVSSLLFHSAAAADDHVEPQIGRAHV